MSFSAAAFYMLATVCTANTISLKHDIHKQPSAQLCRHLDHKAPCKCSIDFVDTYVAIKNTSGEYKVDIEYIQYSCATTSNPITDAFQCTQLEANKSISIDINNNPIDVRVVYKAGCELRCTNEFCREPEKIVVTDSDTYSYNNDTCFSL